MSDFEIKALFVTSRRIIPIFDSLSFGKYTIEPIPSPDTGNTSATNLYLLRFLDKKGPADIYDSNPVREAKLILSMLSLCLGTRLEIMAFMVNSVNLGVISQDAAASGITGIIENLPDLHFLWEKLNGLNIDIARQFLRAADVYQSAVNLIGQNNTLSYFLLTIAIECLSNSLESGLGTCDRFVQFIFTYLRDKTQIESEEDWKALLKGIYYRNRSGFTHGGKEIPVATDLADRLDRIFVKNIIDGKEVKTPSLKWFEAVVRNVLIDFLITFSQGSTETGDRIKEISLEQSAVKLIFTRDINAGDIVTEQDVDLD